MTPDHGAPYARLCHIVKWDNFDGYGFNLHAEKGKSGQFIGKVDEGSPSEASGLRQGDRIVEVNEINIASETHKQVVERIKAFPTETKLLVVDQRADDYFKANNVPIKGTMPGVRILKTPERNLAEHEDEEEEEDLGRRPNDVEYQVTNDTHSIGSAGETFLHHENGNGSGITRHEDDDNTSEKSTASGKEQPNGSSLNLAMSAKELRAKLAMRKKYDPKKESLGFKDKFDIVQKL
ncbi:PREDICTED: Na(+)/H(+) exchange regulatory cofactor NHE-RF1 [Ceratosolen solmsi marchali]|uniref:Na(+)/H(+) exchange regulatory cofactor NHE-RF1 n=1 Tax=Ceratosolen solmsi marchali TaxID=326594 RepID=A0AAJ6YS45_9HYME|nr:PREDICTED: Na(+)/H(+) exchange regulatory cofactor NHE-RF1 [Ceratosolen solmsi marchali]